MQAAQRFQDDARAALVSAGHVYVAPSSALCRAVADALADAVTEERAGLRAALKDMFPEAPYAREFEMRDRFLTIIDARPPTREM